VLVDGVPANAMGGGFDFAHLATANVERIEIVRGPQSALHGSNAIGGVVSVVTRRGGPPTASAAVEAGSLGTSRVAAGTSGSSRAWGWTGTFERTASDGLVQNDDYRRAMAAAGLGWSGARGANLRADVRYTDDERGFPGPFGSDPGGTFSGIDTVSRGSNERWLGAVAGTVAAGARTRVHGQLAHARIDGRQISAFDPSTPSEITSRRSGGRLHADVTIQPSMQLSAGGEVYRERGTSTFITDTSGSIPIDRTLAGLFGEVRWNHNGRVFLTGGVRADRIARASLAGNPAAFTPRPDFPEDVVTSVNPKAGVAWFVRSSEGSFTKLRASAGSGIRPPDAFEIAFTDNPSLEPERSRSFEAGIDHSFAAGRVAVEATGFHNRYDDLIIAVGSFGTSSRYRTDNISNARAQGLELAGTARGRVTWGVPVDLLLRVSLTFLDTEILAVDGGTGAPPPFTPGESLLRRPARQFAAEWTVRSGRFNAFATAGGRSETRDVDPSFGTFGGLFDAPGYATVNAGAAWRIGRRVEVFGRVTNLLDRDYEEALGFPAPGRGGMAGLRIAAGR
jgi:outer membrane receptor protein involved in Fe transport